MIDLHCDVRLLAWLVERAIPLDAEVRLCALHFDDGTLVAQRRSDDRALSPPLHDGPQAFLDAAGGSVQTHEMKARGPDDEALYMDIAIAGDADARDVLVLTSGVHGVELFAGSRCQVRVLCDPACIPSGVKLVCIHGANPWGAAHVRRNNELNVDLCRNFYDTETPPARNEDYERGARASGAGR